MEERVLNSEQVRKNLELTLLRIGSLEGELVETVKRLKEQRTAVWSTIVFTEEFCREKAKLWEIKADKAKIKRDIKVFKRRAKDLNLKMIAIGNREYRRLNAINDNQDDDDDDDEDENDEYEYEEFDEQDQDAQDERSYQQELMSGFFGEVNYGDIDPPE